MISEGHAKNATPAEVLKALEQRTESITRQDEPNQAPRSESDGNTIVEECVPEAEAPSTTTETLDWPSGIAASREPRASAALAALAHAKCNGVGAMLNERFELVEQIGSGGMSIVYKAIDHSEVGADDRNKYITIKVLKRKLQAHRGWVVALQQEARKCRGLIHPNIVQVHEFNHDGSVAFLVMEYLSGESLGRKIRSGRVKQLTTEQILRIINETGQALAFAHEHGIVHCDVKPVNVFLTDSGKVKVIDFGIARVLRGTPETDLDQQRLQSGTSSAVTPAYASPERLEHHDPDPRDDIYALACTAYELLTGVHPFNRMRATAARDAGLKVESRDGLSDTQWAALQGALAFDRHQRTPSVTQFLAELNVQRSARQHALPILASILVVAGILLGVVIYSYFGAELLERERQAERSNLLSKLGDLPRNEQPLQGRNQEISSLQTQLSAIRQVRLETTAQAEVQPTPREEQVEQGEQGSVEIAPLELPLTELLALAETQLVAKRLTTPAGDSALETYRAILQLAPEHGEAIQGIAKIKAQFRSWAQAAMRRGDWVKAQAYLAKAAAIDPQDSTLEEAMRQLEQAKRSAEAQALSKAQEEAARQAPKETMRKGHQTQATRQREPVTTAKVHPAAVQPPSNSMRALTYIGAVEHNVVDREDAAIVSIRADITRPVMRAEVFLETDQGFTPYPLYDDGTRGDHIANDRSYQAQIRLANARRSTRYYVAAYTDQGTAFYSPADADKETHIIEALIEQSRAPVVINEFMASNDQTIADPQGDYDDWIELCNTTPNTIDLSGYYLSDDPAKPKKWRFPQGTELVGYGYLLIWADDESLYTNTSPHSYELHANFELSRFGEHILLVDTDENGNAILDRITFDRQGSDSSTARTPNGLGKFDVASRPTPGRPNSKRR